MIFSTKNKDDLTRATSLLRSEGVDFLAADSVPQLDNRYALQLNNEAETFSVSLLLVKNNISHDMHATTFSELQG